MRQPRTRRASGARGIRDRLPDRDSRVPFLGCRASRCGNGNDPGPTGHPARDHIYGSLEAPYEIVEYGDFQCPFCLKASGSIQDVREALGDDVRYVWRHAPLVRQHPNALAGAEAAEAAARQGRFWEYERGLFADQDNQRPADIVRLAERLGLDVDRFERDLTSAEVTSRVRDDMLDAEAMNITSVPSFFINGRRYTGPYDAQTLIRTLRDTAPQPATQPAQDR